MRECVCGCWLSVLTSHQYRSLEQLAMALFSITAFLFACHVPDGSESVLQAAKCLAVL